MPSELAARGAIGREGKLYVPQRTGADHLPGGVERNLPVKARQRPQESGLSRGMNEREITCWIAVKAGNELIEIDVELGLDPPLNVTLEKNQQPQ
jgi:hypothetical protein